LIQPFFLIIKLVIMPLITGTWKINANGLEGDFFINNLQADSRFTGTVLGVPCVGFWNDGAQMIFFQALAATGGAVVITAQFKGYLFSTPPLAPPGSDIKWTLCGHLTSAPAMALGNTEPSARRLSFGWFATVTQVV
jgi:hypothetical protein